MLQIANELIVEQGTPEWFAGRLGRATASNFPAIMSNGRNGGEAVGRINYRAQLVAERVSGQKEDTYKSKEMIWGTETEPLARLNYMLLTGNQVTECGFFAHKKLMAGASPDGLVDKDGTLEIKCPNTATHIETLKKQEVPTQYYWQIQGQLWMTGRTWCDFVSCDPRLSANAQTFIKRVQRDDAQIKLLEQKVIEFLETVDREELFVRNYKSKGGKNE